MSELTPDEVSLCVLRRFVYIVLCYWFCEVTLVPFRNGGFQLQALALEISLASFVNDDIV